jgi:hypothetical protein
VKQAWLLVFAAMLAAQVPVYAQTQNGAQNEPQTANGGAADEADKADKADKQDKKTEEAKNKPPAKPVGKWVFSFGGGIVLFNEDGGLETAPPPVLPVPFASFDWTPLRLGIFNLALDGRLEIYWTDYLILDGHPPPYPAMIESRQSFVMGIVPALAAKAYIQLPPVMLKAALGFSADLRIVTTALDLNEADMEVARRQTSQISDYFWGNGRFFRPIFIFGADLPVTGRWRVGLDVEISIPIMEMALSETSGVENWRFGFFVSISGHFDGKKPQKPNANVPST